MKGYARSVWTKQSGYKQMKELMEMHDQLINELGNELLICDLKEYDNGYISDIIMEISDANIDIYYYDLKRWLSDHINDFEDYIEGSGYNEDGTLYDNIQAAQYVSNEHEMYNNLETGIQLYIVDALINRNINEIPEDLENDIYMLDCSYDQYDRLEELNEQIETWINEYHLDCSLENVKKLSDKLGYKEFRNCIDNDDIYRTIDDLNQSRESHYNENDIIGGYESYTIYGYTTIELKRGLNYVTPVDIVEKLVFEEWNDDEQMYMSCSSKYIGISTHDYSILNESEEN